MSERDGLGEVLADLPPMLSSAQVSKLLGMSLQGVQKWLKEGVLPGYKVGRTWFVTRTDLERVFRAGSNKPTTNHGHNEG